MFDRITHEHKHYYQCPCTAKIEEVLRLLRELKMALSQDFLDLAAKIDAATNAVAARIAALGDKVKNSMTDAEVASVKTALQAEADRLTVLGSDPVNPVP